jgi:1,4-dihydroxy-2-naphthoate octaprenyltransferase
VREYGTSLRTYAGLFATELSAIVAALIAGLWLNSLWLLIFLVPLVLKIIATVGRVPREPLKWGTTLDAPEKKEFFEMADG